MKICSKCGIEKDELEFDPYYGKPGKLKGHCKQCRKEYVKDHYIRNKQQYLDKADKNRSKYIAEFIDYKKGLHCLDCGLSFHKYPWLCDFHHLDRNKKDFNIATLRESMKRFKEEIKKCIPLCANCHRTRHYKEKLGDVV